MTIATTDFEYLATLISERTGNIITPSQDYLVESRLSGLVREKGLPSVDSLVRELRTNRNSGLEDQVAEAMTINETSFFRDPDAFDTLREHVIPDLIARRQSTREISVWCAACSSGQEPYTLAMMIKEDFPELRTWKVNIHCTDVSQQMVDRTRKGAYSQFEANRGLPAKMLLKYFQRDKMEWIASQELRSLMSFQTCNLTKAWGLMPKADLVMLRNVLIYFDKTTKEGVLGRVKRVLAVDGYLFLGGGETTVNLNTTFQSQMIGKTPVYRTHLSDLQTNAGNQSS